MITMKCDACGSMTPVTDGTYDEHMANGEKCSGSGKTAPRGDGRVRRYEHLDAAALRPPQRLDNGFLRVEGRIARVGVQEYADGSGGVRRELRLPEEVFDKASLDSFQQVPVTNRHPPQMLTADNAKQYAVGSVGESVRRDGDYVVAPLMITDSQAIAAAEAGRSQLSNGYSCELAPPDQTLFDKWGKHDAIQRVIRGNHCALVDVARAGPDARIRLDAGDAVAGLVARDTSGAVGSVNNASKDNEEKRMHKFQLDGFSIEVTDANMQGIVERAIASGRKDADEKLAAAIAKADQAKKDLDAAIADKSTLQGKFDTMEVKAKADAELVATFDSRVVESAKQIGSLYEEARKHLGANAKLDGGEIDVKKQVIAKLLPTLKLDGKDDNYVRAVYDGAIAAQPAPVTALDRARAATTEVVTTKADAAPATDPEEARRKMIERTHALNKK